MGLTSDDECSYNEESDQSTTDQWSDWSDISSDAEPTRAVNLEARAYQIEMFERSNQGNIIVVFRRWTPALERHKCKTIRRRRENLAADERPQQLTPTTVQSKDEDRSRTRSDSLQGSNIPSCISSGTLIPVVKRVWFTAPSVPLAYQQHSFLETQLPAYMCRLIVGSDKPELWSTKDVWAKVLQKVNIVVSTPQILLDALSNAFVSLADIALLVFDEAHHCNAKSPMARIMSLHYHPLKQSQPDKVPHILGLTASPITKKQSGMEKLEAIMDSTCVTPHRQLEEYRKYVYQPELEKLAYDHTILPQSKTVTFLKMVLDELKLEDDPVVRRLHLQTSEAARAKLTKIYRKEKTVIMQEVNTFHGNAQLIEADLGPWASVLYVHEIIERLRFAANEFGLSVVDTRKDETQYLLNKLRPVSEAVHKELQIELSPDRIAPKAATMIKYLQAHHKSGNSSIVFVERRAMAFALAKLLDACQNLKEYHVFSFVGVSNATYRSWLDIADLQSQRENFAGFRSGKRDLCIATSVAEEGVDVKAVNLVVRFDAPSNFRAFIQSRGRARQKDSRLVMLHPSDIDPSKIAEWIQTENDMRKQLQDLKQELARREELDDLEDFSGEIYRVKGTGALLNYDNARARLQHYCTTLPRTIESQPEEPVFILSDTSKDQLVAEVRLPQSVPLDLQITRSRVPRNSEKNACKDAAFQCYRRLHLHGLVNDHLLPFPPPEEPNDEIEKAPSMYNARSAIDVWKSRIQKSTSTSCLYVHTIQTRNQSKEFPKMLCLLQSPIDHHMQFTLHSTPFGDMQVDISPDKTSFECDTNLCMEVTQTFFNLILGRRLTRSDVVPDLPFLLLPAISASELPLWYSKYMASNTSPTEFDMSKSLSDEDCLLRHKKENILYHWKPRRSDRDTGVDEITNQLQAVRLTKQLDFTKADLVQPSTKERTLDASQCEMVPLPAIYGEFVLLMPSILSKMEPAMRATHAVLEGPLKSIGFENARLVTIATTGSSADAERNYELLEFVGDALLKFYASVQVTWELPLATEEKLTRARQRIVANSSLHKITRTLAIDSYMSLDAFSGQKWTLSAPSKVEDFRAVSSKTLADVIEALLAAAYLDKGLPRGNEKRILSALKEFWPKVEWQCPSSVASESQQYLLPGPSQPKLEPVEDMLGYKFKNQSLLVEALTRTSDRPGMKSYDRLEFLGDALLDHLITSAIWRGSHKYSPAKMTLIRIALVNNSFLAFIAMNNSKSISVKEVTTTASGRHEYTDRLHTKRLVDYIGTRGEKAEIERRAMVEAAFLKVQEVLLDTFARGDSYPWTRIESIGAPKMYSDIIESLLCAVFVDCGGDEQVCDGVLEALGISSILRRMLAVPDYDACRPLVKLRERHPQIQILQKSHKGIHRCRVLLDDRIIASCRSFASATHASSAAAEAALRAIENTN